MLCPLVMSRMEEANNRSALGINAGHVWPFEAVAMDASKSEIIEIRSSPVLPCNNVVDLKGRRVACRGQLTILTASRCPVPNLVYKISVQTHCLLRRAVESATASRLHDSQKIADVDIAVELSLFLGG